jgi:hypothetical protein
MRKNLIKSKILLSLMTRKKRMMINSLKLVPSSPGHRIPPLLIPTPDRQPLQSLHFFISPKIVYLVCTPFRQKDRNTHTLLINTATMKKHRHSSSARLLAAGLFSFSCLTGIAQTTFSFTGGVQTYTVPPGVTSITIETWGAQGSGGNGGNGGYAKGDMTVTPGQVLNVYVGGQTGYNGGGSGHAALNRNGGGGSDVRIAPYALANRVIVAGGGGAGGPTDVGIRNGGGGGSGTVGVNYAGGGGGNGYGGNGGNGGVTGGTGNTSCHSGGAGGGGLNSGGAPSCNTCYTNTCGQAGTLGQGGNSDTWENGICYTSYGGTNGGGGGYYGGGGSSVGNCGGGGGGGGSSWTGTLTNITLTGGIRTGNGQIIITPLVVYNASVVQNAAIQCFGQSTASLTATPNGGTAPYTYSWAPSGGTTATASGLGAGTYTVTVTDANSAVTTQTFTVTQPTALAVSASAQTNISCNGGSNGSATVTGTGGTGAYSYSWSPSGGTAATASALAAGGYTVTVTDANSCSTTQTFNITEPAALASTSTQTDVTCNGGSNGDATVVSTGGTPGYTYNWLPSGGTAATASGLPAGIYTCTITDANGCSSTQSVSISEPTALAAIATSMDAMCNGSSDGSASVTASGGTPGYTYNWAPTGGTAATATGLAAGTYTCTITDANNCTMTQTVLVSEPDALIANPTSTSALCNGNSNGSATVAVFGGTSPYTYSWAPTGGTAATATGLAAGTYTCTITDVNNCVTTQTVVVTQPASLSAAIVTATNPVFCNGTNGSIDLSVNGGTPNYTYAWSNSANTQDVNGLAAGTYSVTITDANNCTATQTVTLVDPNPPTVSLTLPVATVCLADGAVVLSGGTPAGGTYSGPGVSGTLFTPANAGIGMNTITYSYTDLSTGCSGTNTDVVFVDACIGIIESANNSNFIVFPNPNNGTFTLQLKTTDAADVLIYDALGKLISRTRVNPDVQQQLQLTDAGMYLVTVITADGARSTQRVTVAK